LLQEEEEDEEQAEMMGEEEEEEEEEEAREPDPSPTYTPGESHWAIHEFRDVVDHVKAQQENEGLPTTGLRLIQEYGQKAGWEDWKIKRCCDQFLRWIEDSEEEIARRQLPTADITLLWRALGFAAPWSALAEFAGLLVSLPIAETENERFFSIRRYVVGGRGGRTKNEVVTARVRIRTSYGNET
jgi:hypothetical protein